MPDDPTPTLTPEPGAAPPNATVCPTCGSTVVVEGSDEGTRYFRPVGYATDLHAEIARLTADLAARSAEVETLKLASVALLGCIDTSAADNGPPVTQGSMMAQVCKVLQRTTQYGALRAAVGEAG